MNAAWLSILTLLPGTTQETPQPTAPATVWVLPLETAAGIPSDLGATLADLLTIEIGRSTAHAVVTRTHLTEVLAERSLSAAQAASRHHRQELGHLLGADWILHGTIARHDDALTITTHLTEVRSTRIVASGVATGNLTSLPSSLSRLIASTLPATQLPPQTKPRTRTPEADLHFLRGLTHFDAGHYHRALADFLRSSSAPELKHLSTLWQANCYLATETYDQAFLTLLRLRQLASPQLSLDLSPKLQRCRQHLSPQELSTYELLSRTP